jgi:hypothetical protein
MPTYRLMNTLTDEGRKTVKERPDRIGEVNQELEGMGARVISGRHRPAIARWRGQATLEFSWSPKTEVWYVPDRAKRGIQV